MHFSRKRTGPFGMSSLHMLESHAFIQRRDFSFAHHGCHNRPTWRRHPEERIAHGDRQEEDFDLGPWFATYAARYGHGHDRRCAGDGQQEECGFSRVEYGKGNTSAKEHCFCQSADMTVIVSSFYRRPCNSNRQWLCRRELQLHPHPEHAAGDAPPLGL